MVEYEKGQQRDPNARLIAARQAASLSQEQLARHLGVSQGAVSQWERYSAVPRDEELRWRVEELLGQVWPAV
jgi:transcriptional regulator with XRE-family HTH domain